MATRRHYAAEFKLEVVNMVIDQGIAISKLSKDLSISDNLIRRWMKQLRLEQSCTVLKNNWYKKIWSNDLFQGIMLALTP